MVFHPHPHPHPHPPSLFFNYFFSVSGHFGTYKNFYHFYLSEESNSYLGETMESEKMKVVTKNKNSCFLKTVFKKKKMVFDGKETFF